LSPSTQNTASEAAAATTTPAAPTTRSTPRTTSAAPPVRLVAPATTTPAPVVRPAPQMAMTCPGGGSLASPVFGQQITATAPYTVTIDYGDGETYTNDGSHLGAIFAHTYRAAGSFAVSAVLTDATNQT